MEFNYNEVLEYACIFTSDYRGILRNWNLTWEKHCRQERIYCRSSWYANDLSITINKSPVGTRKSHSKGARNTCCVDDKFLSVNSVKTLKMSKFALINVKKIHKIHFKTKEAV